MKSVLLLALCVGLLSTSYVPSSLADEGYGVDVRVAPLDKNDFRASLRKLWEDHITWTRLFIISDAANLPDKASTTQRLLQNQKDIGSAVIPFYGRNNGLKLTKLLTDHILIASQVVDAAKARDQNLLKQANDKWFANAGDIAKFLATANPHNWSFNEMKAMMDKHLTLTTTEASAYLKGDYGGSVAAYDQVHAEILMMSDMLADGIIAQFPAMFK